MSILMDTGSEGVNQKHLHYRMNSRISPHLASTFFSYLTQACSALKEQGHKILWRWGRLLPVINVFHFYYLLWGEASEGVSGGEGRGVRGKRRADGEAKTLHKTYRNA